MATFSNPLVNAEVPTGVQYTITATATALSNSSILGAGSIVPSKLTIKNADGAANACYLGPSTVTNDPAGAWVQLGAGDSYTFEYQSPNTIYIVGTANAANIAYIVAEYSDRQT